MQVLFLDIDGVLVTAQPGKFHDDLIQALARVVRGSGCEIVLSSDWRSRAEGLAIVAQHLENAGLRLLGATRPTVADGERPQEIADWIRDQTKTTRPVTHYVVIDDRSLLRERGGEYMQGHFVQTRLIRGLTAEKADEALAILEGPPLMNDLLRSPEAADQALLLLQRMLRGRAAQNRLWVEKEDYLDRQPPKQETKLEGKGPEAELEGKGPETELEGKGPETDPGESLFARAMEVDPGPCPETAVEVGMRKGLWVPPSRFRGGRGT